MGISPQKNQAGSGERVNHNQMDRNFANERNKAEVKGQSTTPPKK